MQPKRILSYTIVLVFIVAWAFPGSTSAASPAANFVSVPSVQVFQDQTTFYAELDPDTIGVVDFDYYPNGAPVPTGYDPAGHWSGFELMGDEWSSLGVIFSTPSGQPMSTVNITELPEGNFWYNFSSPPNSLTPGQPPFVGYGVPHSPDTGDPLSIQLDPPRWAAGLVFVDNSPVGDSEHVEFRAADGNLIADLPSPATGYLSFLGVISDIPIASILIFEEVFDGDDVSYDDIAFGIPVGLEIEATIDIKPGSFPNAINCKNQMGVIPVAILTTEDFNALTVDHTTVRFEGTKEIHVDKGTGLPVRHVEDVDLDGDMDLVFHFHLRNTMLTCASTTGKLVGATYDGIPVEGTDSFWMVTR
jgi:hypothetical protein